IKIAEATAKINAEMIPKVEPTIASREIISSTELTWNWNWMALNQRLKVRYFAESIRDSLFLAHSAYCAGDAAALATSHWMRCSRPPESPDALHASKLS